MQRVVILGRGGSGKSVLAQRLSSALDLPVVELDGIFWRPAQNANGPKSSATSLRPTAGSSTATSAATTRASNCACARRTPSSSWTRTVALCVAGPSTATGNPRILDVVWRCHRDSLPSVTGASRRTPHTRTCTCCATPARCGASSTVRRERAAGAKTLVCGWITGCFGSGRSAERCRRTRRCRRKGRPRRSPRQRRWRDPMRRSCRWHRVASR